MITELGSRVCLDGDFLINIVCSALKAGEEEKGQIMTEQILQNIRGMIAG